MNFLNFNAHKNPKFILIQDQIFYLITLIALFITSFIVPILPYILSFAAGAMIYVVVEELIPEAKEGEHTNLSTIGLQLDLHL